MVVQFILNVGLGLLWLTLSETQSFPNFLFGYLLGMLFLFLFYSQQSARFYMKPVLAVVKLFLIFCWEILISNLNVLVYVFRPISDLHPGIVAMDVDFKTDFELTLLTSLITMTPGTMTVDVAENEKRIYIHALDCSHPEALVQHIRNTFEKSIKEVTGYYD